MNRRGFNINDPFEIILMIMGLLVIIGCCAFGEDVKRWDTFDLELAGPSNDNPYMDVELSATFTQGEETYRPEGFYYGDEGNPLVNGSTSLVEARAEAPLFADDAMDCSTGSFSGDSDGTFLEACKASNHLGIEAVPPENRSAFVFEVMLLSARSDCAVRRRGE